MFKVIRVSDDLQPSYSYPFFRYSVYDRDENITYESKYSIPPQDLANYLTHKYEKRICLVYAYHHAKHGFAPLPLGVFRRKL